MILYKEEVLLHGGEEVIVYEEEVILHEKKLTGEHFYWDSKNGDIQNLVPDILCPVHGDPGGCHLFIVAICQRPQLGLLPILNSNDHIHVRRLIQRNALN